MLYPEEHSADLKRWIVKRLENTSDADADVLADYVLALLRHDGDPQAVRTLCETEIPDFLKEDSTVFVNDVFEAIAHKSYLPGAPQPRAQQQQQHAPYVPSAPDPYGLSYDDVPIPQGSQAPPPPVLNDPRKRTFNDRGEAGAQNGRDTRFDGRPYKQARRGGAAFGNGGRGGGPEDPDSFKGANLPVPPFPNLPGQQPPFPFPPPPPNALFDPEALKAFLEMSFAGNPAAAQSFAPMFPGQPTRQPGRRRPRCRDYDTKGYCSRGNTCNFQHGDDPIYTPQIPLPYGPSSGTQLIEEYDPANALLPNVFNSSSAGQSPQNNGPGMGRPGYGRGGRNSGQTKRHRGKAPFSADGPVLDKTKSSIVVENIPEENFTEEQVREFFSQFGTILEVSLQPYRRTAIVKFDSWAAANAAYKSPKVVFENRFVKIFWHKDDETSPSANGKAANGTKKTGGSSVTGQSESGHVEGGTPPPEIDMEEVTRQLEEAQKVHEEKAKKLKEIEAQREEVEKRRIELETQQREAKVKLAKLLRKSSKKEGEDDSSETDPSKPKSTSEALRAQLAALEAEAMELGIDPDAPPPDETAGHHNWAPRGGRGGYPYRSRGYAPRGFRGGFRGGRGNNHAAYAMYSLDNRPKTIILTGVDFTIPEKDEMLRQYLFGVGEFTSVETSPTSTSISFKDRKTAERFFNEVASNGVEILGIKDGGQLELAWAGSSSSTVSSSAAGTPGSSNATAATTGMDNNTTGGGGNTNNTTTAVKNGTGPLAGTTTTTHHNNSGGGHDENSSDDKDVNIILELDQQQHHHHHHPDNVPSQHNDSMDYDIADDNQWD